MLGKMATSIKIYTRVPETPSKQTPLVNRGFPPWKFLEIPIGKLGCSSWDFHHFFVVTTRFGIFGGLHLRLSRGVTQWFFQKTTMLLLGRYIPSALPPRLITTKIYHVSMKKGQIPSHMWGELVKSTSIYFQLQDTQFKDPILDDVTLRKMTFHPGQLKLLQFFDPSL